MRANGEWSAQSGASLRAALLVCGLAAAFGAARAGAGEKPDRLPVVVVSFPPSGAALVFGPSAAGERLAERTAAAVETLSDADPCLSLGQGRKPRSPAEIQRGFHRSSSQALVLSPLALPEPSSYGPPRTVAVARPTLAPADSAWWLFCLAPAGSCTLQNPWRAMPDVVELPTGASHFLGDIQAAMRSHIAAKSVPPPVAWRDGVREWRSCHECQDWSEAFTTLRALGVDWLEALPEKLRPSRRARIGAVPQDAPTLVSSRWLVTGAGSVVVQAPVGAVSPSGHFVEHRPFQGPLSCPEGKRYREEVQARQLRLVAKLAELTGWSSSEITARSAAAPSEP